jgi:hypothetical protein
MKSRNQVPVEFALFLIVLILSPVIAAQKANKKDDNARVTVPQKEAKTDDKAKEKNLPAVVWRDPGDASALDVFYGAGGKEHAPDANGKFTFVSEDMNGTSPKFDVEGEHGVEWRVKLGEEPQAETAATRLLWAAGYFVDEDYYLADFKVQGLSKLHRGDKLISDDGTVHHARLKRHIKNVKKLGNWDWFHNQCGPAKELNGLRVMMAFVNNWDLKTINNDVEEVNGEQRCMVTDVGASFGKTGNSFVRSKSVEKDYANSDFIGKVTPEYVDFVMHSRPSFIAAINIPNERTRGRMAEITKHIPLADAKWLGQRLALLSVDQIHDCFRAAGYTPKEVDGYTATVQDRIAALNAL